MIRPAAPHDVPALAVLEQELFGADGWSADQLLAETEAPGHRGWVAVEEQASGVADPSSVPGYCLTRTLGEICDLQRIAVTRDRQRTGLARTLLDTALAAAAADGADRMLLEVSDRNAAAVALYARVGFTEIDRRPRYYSDGSDAIVMRRSLARGCSWEAS